MALGFGAPGVRSGISSHAGRRARPVPSSPAVGPPQASAGAGRPPPRGPTPTARRGRATVVSGSGQGRMPSSRTVPATAAGRTMVDDRAPMPTRSPHAPAYAPHRSHRRRRPGPHGRTAGGSRLRHGRPDGHPGGERPRRRCAARGHRRSARCRRDGRAGAGRGHGRRLAGQCGGARPGERPGGRPPCPLPGGLDDEGGDGGGRAATGGHRAGSIWARRSSVISPDC